MKFDKKQTLGEVRESNARVLLYCQALYQLTLYIRKPLLHVFSILYRVSASKHFASVEILNSSRKVVLKLCVIVAIKIFKTRNILFLVSFLQFKLELFLSWIRDN